LNFILCNFSVDESLTVKLSSVYDLLTINFNDMASPKNYLSPEELMQQYPQVQSLGWCASKIGIFFSSGLLVGYRSGKEYKALILESSFVDLVEFANGVTLKKQIKF